MAFRDVLALLLDADADDAAIVAARRIALLNGAARAFLLQVDPEPTPAIASYVRSELWAELSARAREGFADEEEKLRVRLARLQPPAHVTAGLATSRGVRARAEREARCADLSVMIRPSADGARVGAAQRALFEGALMGSGRPVLLIPQGWRDGAIGQKVVIAWRDRREAARAVADAAPLLDVAGDILVVSVNPERRSGRHITAEDVAAHLKRRGLKARTEWRRGEDEGRTVLDACAETGADLLVMGGYGRALWRESILGGVTQTVLAMAHVPVLMSH